MFNVGLFFTALLVITASMGVIRITSLRRPMCRPLLCVLVRDGSQLSIFNLHLSIFLSYQVHYSGFDFGLTATLEPLLTSIHLAVDHSSARLCTPSRLPSSGGGHAKYVFTTML